jgi:hypothetical protein
MATGEDETKSVVRDRHVVSHALDRVDRRELGLDGNLAAELFGLLAQPTAAAQSIDRPVARGRRDPGARVGRDAPLRPRLERRDERVLDGFLGEVEIAQDADERRDGSPLLLAEQAVDDVARGVIRRGQPACAASATGAPASSNWKIGRTSIEPWFAPGMRAA